MFKQAISFYSLIACALSPVALGDCEDGPCQYLITGDTTCWELIDSGCQAAIGTIWYEDDAPNAPVYLTGGVCDACDASVGQEKSVSYSQTVGWSFCVSVGGSVTWKVPVGPEWSVQVSTELCYDTEVTTTTRALIECGKGEKIEGLVYEINTPSTVHIDIEYTKWGDFVKQDPFPTGCEDSYGETFRDEVFCNTEETTKQIIKRLYYTDFNDLECPTDPGTGGGPPYDQRS